MQRLVWLIWILILYSPELALSQSNTVRLTIPELEKKPVLNRTYQSETSITYLTLANGIRVGLRPMVGKEGNYVDSAVYIRAESVNRKGQYAESDKANAQIGSYLIRYAGVANLDHQQFEQFLKDNKTYFEANGSPVSVGINLKTDPNHVEVALQAIYAFYTKPRTDYPAIRSCLDELIIRYRQRPDTSLESITSDSLRLALVRKGNFLEASDLEKVDPVHAVNMNIKRLANAQDFIFTIVGAYSLEEMIPLLQLYVGNLPTSKADKRPREDNDGSFPNPRLKQTVYRPNISTAVVNWVFLTNYEEIEEGQNNLDQAYVSVLSSRLKKELSKTAHKGERVLVAKEPGQILNMNRFKNRQVGVLVRLHCLPERIDSLSLLVRSTMARLAKEPISDVELDRFRENRSRNSSYAQNSSFTWSLFMWGSSFGPAWPIRAVGDIGRLGKNVTPETLQRTARRYASTKDKIDLTFLPTTARR